MLQSLIKFSLHFRGVVVALACVLMVYGFYIANNAKLDVFPNFVQPQVTVQTECPGLSSEQVELLVTRPIETAVNGLGGMESLRSESIGGLSAITVVFKENTDVFRARETLAEALSETAGQLPATVKTPRLTPLTSSTMDLLKIGLVSDTLSPMELRTFADWTLKPRLLSVAGVAKCSVFGGDVRQLQIQVLPERLRVYDLALADVLAAARQSTAVVGAGWIETTNQRIILQTESQALSVAELADTVIKHTNGASVRLQDVARVMEGAEPKFGGTVIQGRWGILMTMSSQYGANTMEVTKSLEAALEGMRPTFEAAGIKIYPRLHRPATFIETALANMKRSLWHGAILVVIVLFVLLGSVRTAFISLLAIPLSLLIAIITMEKLGITINTITLGGLVIALGEVVDDSIIDVENIFRRMRENEAAANPRPYLTVIFDASVEVRHAVVFATFIVILVFVPVLTLTGLQGSFFSPLAVSYILAILASLLVALTLTPALAFLLLNRSKKISPEPRLQHWLKNIYHHFLGIVFKWPRMVIVAVVLLCVLAATRVPFFGGEFLPAFREGHFVLQVTAAPGTSLPEMLRIGTRISKALLANEHVATVGQQAGRAELGEDPWGPQRCEFHVELKSVTGSEQEKMGDELRDILNKFPGLQFEVMTFLGDRLSETVSGETAPVVVNVFGDDLDELDAKAREIASVLKGVSGAADVQVKSPPGEPRLQIRLKPERLSQFGMRPAELAEAVQTAYQGTIVAQTHQATQGVDVVVILDQADHNDPESVSQLQIRNAEGLLIPLSEIAEVFQTSGRFSIAHESGRRRQTITCATSGRDVSSFVDEAKKRVEEKVKLATGSYLVFSGEAEAKAQAQHQLLFHSLLAGVGILILLSVAFQSWLNIILVLANVPFAFVGGVLAIWAASILSPGASAISIGSLIGFVTLFGITMRNSIMMISHYEHLVTVEGMSWGEAAAMRGASERLMPVLMTAIVTGLGLLPLALGSGEAGREIEGPMAIVILGGLVTSTTLNLLVLPTLALRYGKFRNDETKQLVQDGT